MSAGIADRLIPASPQVRPKLPGSINPHGVSAEKTYIATMARATRRRTVSTQCIPEFDVIEQDPPAPLPFERRMIDRWPMQGKASAICVAGETFGEIFDLRMLDFSPGGMGAMSDRPLPPGMIITVGFQEPGQPARRGTVTRCQPWGDGYRIGIVFQMRLAA